MKQFGDAFKCYTELSYEPAIPLQGVYPRELRTNVQAKQMFTLVHECSQKHYSKPKSGNIKWQMDKNSDIRRQWNVIHQ